jgi:hypothetical protein
LWDAYRCFTGAVQPIEINTALLERGPIVKVGLMLLFCFVLGTACSDTSPPAGVSLERGSSEVAGKDACELMTLTDVEEVYGQSMSKSDRNIAAEGPSANLSVCTYQSENALIVATLMATWSTSGGPLASRDAYAVSAERDIPAELREALAVEKVEFQGMPALWQAGQLKVFKDGVMLSILADGASGKDARQTIQDLMARVVERV